MLLTTFLFLHLVATCAAIGTIVITDLRLMATLMDYRVLIPPPQRFETVMITFRRGASANQHDYGRRLADRRISGPPDRRGANRWP